MNDWRKTISRPGGWWEVNDRPSTPGHSEGQRNEERMTRLPADWNLPWREVVPIEDGPNWSAAQFLAICCWPRKPKKWHDFAWALFHAAAREANVNIPDPPRLRDIRNRTRGAAQRLERGLIAAEIARLALEPPERAVRGDGVLTTRTAYVRGPGSQAIVGDKVSRRRLEYIAREGFRKLSGRDLFSVKTRDDTDDTFRNNYWREFLPGLPQLVALASCDFVPGRVSLPPAAEEPPALEDPVTLVLHASWWIDQVLSESDHLALDLHQELGIPAEKLILCGPAGRNLLRHQST